MSVARRIVVIMEHGKIIGTQAAPEAPDGFASAASAVLRAGPGQTRFEVMAVLPASLASAQEIEHFHNGLMPLVKKAGG